MFRAILLAAGLILALGTLSPADAARSRARSTGTEAAGASTEAPRASSSRRTRRNEANSQRRSRGSATSSRQRRGSRSAAPATATQ